MNVWPALIRVSAWSAGITWTVPQPLQALKLVEISRRISSRFGAVAAGDVTVDLLVSALVLGCGVIGFLGAAFDEPYDQTEHAGRDGQDARGHGLAAAAGGGDALTGPPGAGNTTGGGLLAGAFTMPRTMV